MNNIENTMLQEVKDSVNEIKRGMAIFCERLTVNTKKLEEHDNILDGGNGLTTRIKLLERQAENDSKLKWMVLTFFIMNIIGMGFMIMKAGMKLG